MSATREEAMAKALDDLWRLWRELDEKFGGKEAVEQVVYTSKESLATLEELAPAVLSGGGVHGSTDAAWSVWQDLAQSTGDTMTAAMGYGSRWSLGGYLRAAGQVALDTAKNVVTGASAGITTIQIVAVVVGLYFVSQIVRGARA